MKICIIIINIITIALIIVLNLWISRWGIIYIRMYIHIHMQCSTVLIEKLTCSQLFKNFPLIYGTRRFITTLISARQLSLSSASSIHSMNSTFHSLKIHLDIISPATPGSPKWSLSLKFPHPKPCINLSFPHSPYMPIPIHSSLIYHPKNIKWILYVIMLLVL